jgi:Rab5 GDP/GTP exchange factor
LHKKKKNGTAVDWSVAVNHLRNMEKESGPSAKMDKIVMCSKEITQVLTVAMDGELPGADDFLPAMILVLKLAKPKKLQSTLTFIQEYCPENKLISEAGYIFTHLSSALSFLMVSK